MAHPYKSKSSDGYSVAKSRYAEGGGISDKDRKDATDAFARATRWRVDRYGDLSGAQRKLSEHISNMVPRRGLLDDGLDIPRKARGGKIKGVDSEPGNPLDPSSKPLVKNADPTDDDDDEDDKK